ncbi:SprT-like domain-containing protein [Nonlabens ponticola]|uniref:SprT domain-containing protein n=1 Tax=Nonlabens ponticola TaxID=2496866 RepID=A0A3S9N082_9FLAO|nr:SprT-like domain-containing protein [Nonlabens ponticola]AZQ44732.1 sprT domain-containing protein [Nonlabens ponticola]
MAVLDKYLPALAVQPLTTLLETYHVHLKIVNERATRHGDYRPLPDGSHRITINSNLNPYRFLVTLVHEIAHLVAFKKYGYRIKPHGIEWKMTFQKLMLPFLRPEVFPTDLLPVMARHFKNPRASSDTDSVMSVALRSYDPPSDKIYIFELERGALFKAMKGRTFKRGNKLRKRYQCVEVATGKMYLFQPNVQVQLYKPV